MDSEPIQVLLVEDDEAHIELIERAFEVCARPARLAVARSLGEARAWLEQATPDVAILDSLLPDGPGRQLLSADRDAPSCPVVMMTSHSDPALRDEAIEAGAFRYIEKSETTLIEIPDIVLDTLRDWDRGQG